MRKFYYPSATIKSARIKSARIIFLILFLLGTRNVSAAFFMGESIALDPSGNYTIVYKDENGELSDATFEPATKIDPAISSSFKLDDKNIVAYHYKLSNGIKSKQSVSKFRFDLARNASASPALLKPIKQVNREDTPTEDVNALTTPLNWEGSVTQRNENIGISWNSLRSNLDITQGIKPGESQNGFGFFSQQLPGIGVAKLLGNVKAYRLSFSGNGPDNDTEIGMRAEQLEQNNFIARNIAVPTILIPEPMDATLLLERIRSHAHSWISLQLLDTAFSAQLDIPLQAAIAACRNNQHKAGKSAIKTARELLAKTYPDLETQDAADEEAVNQGVQLKNGTIARLAARVLDFDLQFVLKQLGEEVGK